VKVTAAPAEEVAADEEGLAAGADVAAGAEPAVGDAEEHPGSVAAIHSKAAQRTVPFVSIRRGLA
jgi:hypothetical protein